MQPREAPPTEPGDMPDLADADAGHLRALSIIYYVVSGLMIPAFLVGALYLAIGIAILVESPTNDEAITMPPPSAPPVFLRSMFLALGGTIMFLAVAAGVAFLLVGRSLARRVHRLFCITVAALACTVVPIGTLLGLFTLLVLTRPAVRRAFDRS